MKAGSETGYSLVELLVVVALLGLIAIGVSGGLTFGARVWERTEREVSSAELVGGGHQVLHALLSGAYPRLTGEAGQERTIAFEGTRERMSLLTAASAQLGASGIAKVTLSVERDGGALSLKLKLEPDVAGLRAQEATLVRDAQAIEFSYGEATGEAVNWGDAWQSRTKLPQLIRIRVRSSDGRATWPELIVHPKLARPVGCIFDPVSFECRNG